MTDVQNDSIIIIIQMYRKRYILQIVLIFLNIDFQRSKGFVTFCEKEKLIKQ